MGALLPLLMAAAPGLINWAEKAFLKPKSGTDKLNAVQQALQVLLNTLFASGQQPVGSENPNVSQIQGVIETLLGQMKQSNTLGSSSSQNGSLYLLQGSITPIKVA